MRSTALPRLWFVTNANDTINKSSYAPLTIFHHEQKEVKEGLRDAA
jgi:hypothetical protein